MPGIAANYGTGKLLMLSIAAVTLLVAACGGGTDDAPLITSPTITESPIVPSPIADDDISDREDDLRHAALQAAEAVINGDAAISYTFQAAGYRERCSFGDYLGTVLFIEAFLGDISGAEATVEGIRFEGERAFVDIQLELNGVDLFGDDDEDEYPNYWILEDGEWKNTSDDPAPCELDFGNGE